MPGVLLLEASAQLCTFFMRKALDPDPEKFFGFGKIDDVRFRGVAVPGDMVVLAAKLIRTMRSMAFFATQAFVDGLMIYEGEIMGSIL